MGHGHHHRHQPHAGAFRWSVLLNSGLTGLQLAIGLGCGSLALISDALHNLGDVAGLLLGWGAERLAAQPATARFTYGFGRSTQFAALLNALLILGAALVVIIEGVERLRHPVPMLALPVAIAALAGVVVNLWSVRLFGGGHQHDLNRRAAVLHLLSDAAVSVAVLVSALLVQFSSVPWLDPLTAIAVGLGVAWSGWVLLRQAVVVSLDGIPPGIDREAVDQLLSQLEGVIEVQQLHIWALSSSRVALSAHLRCRSGATATGALLRQAEQQLKALGIQHSTLQVEPADSAGQGGQAG